jgi:hypothetical protein
MSKRGYAINILQEFGFENCNHVHIPMIEGLKLEFNVHACKRGRSNALPKNHK